LAKVPSERFKGPAPKRVALGIYGASGISYGVRVLEALAEHPEIEAHLIVTEAAKGLLAEETDKSMDDLARLAKQVWDDRQMASPLASGTFPVDSTAVVPCSMSTVAKVAAGVGDTLLTRACAVALKQRRRLVMVPREMPLSTIDLRNLLTLSEAGAVVMVASPPFYTRPLSVADVVDLVAGRVVEMLGVDPGPMLRRYHP
jgi:4-hydroxy-3-polyprenylbenzoate decarboxylase